MSVRTNPTARPSVMDRWARFVHRHRNLVILAWVFMLAGALGTLFTFGGKFEDSFALPGSESQAGYDLLKERFPQQAGDTADIAFEAQAGVNDPAVRKEMEQLFDRIAQIDHVASIESPYDQGRAGYVSADGTIGRAVVRWDARRSGLPLAPVKEFVRLTEEASRPGLDIQPGGNVAMKTEQPELGSEGIGVAAAIVILFVAFGSVMAMGLPIAAAFFGIGTGVGIIALLSRIFAFPDWTTQFVLMIGIGIGVDYSLLVVTRFREGIHHGKSVEDSIALAATTAGRSVIFAGAVVAISFFGLWAMGIPFISAIGTASAIVVAAAVLVATTLMPALLSLVGTRIDRWHVPFLHSTEGVDYNSGWYRFARGIQKRPLPWFVAGTAVLLFLALPTLTMRLGFTDAGNSPERLHSRKAYDLLARGFGPGFNGPLQVAFDIEKGGSDRLENLRAAIAATPNVAQVSPPILSPDGDAAIMTVIPATKPQAEETTDLAHALRRDVLPAGLSGSPAKAYVVGFAASQIDIQDRITGRMPLLFVGVIGVSFLLLTVVFRSLLVAVKAAILNLLSIGAAYGVVVAVFQWGWGSNLLDAGTGPIEVFLPMMFFAILFGFSMDYEVFLISRIREIYAKNGDTATAVAEGLAATARVITAAAAIMVAVFLAFVLGEDRVVKQVGLGLATAIFVDATIVRLILVPATMELLGKANWWLPKWLDRIIPEVHIEGSHLEESERMARTATNPAAGGGR